MFSSAFSSSETSPKCHLLVVPYSKATGTEASPDIHLGQDTRKNGMAARVIKPRADCISPELKPGTASTPQIVAGRHSRVLHTTKGERWARILRRSGKRVESGKAGQRCDGQRVGV